MSKEGSTIWNTDCHLSKIAEEGDQIKRAMTKRQSEWRSSKENKAQQVRQRQELNDDEKANIQFWLLRE